MKTKTLLQFIICVATLPCLAGGDSGNGGGGVFQNNRYMTFYSAGLYTEREPSDINSVPGLAKLVGLLDKELTLHVSDKNALLAATEPSDDRTYYKVDPDHFSNETYNRLKEIYAKIVKVPVDSLVIFALTDTSSKTTFLLPSFFQLKESEQMAILFHETYWVRNPQATYEKVVNAEIKMQNYIEHPSGLSALELLKEVASAESILKFVVDHDLQTKAMGELVSDSKIKFLDLVGDQYINCAKSSAMATACREVLVDHLRSLRSTYPNSLFLKEVTYRLTKEKVRGTLKDHDEIPQEYISINSRRAHLSLISLPFTANGETWGHNNNEPNFYKDLLNIYFPLSVDDGFGCIRSGYLSPPQAPSSSFWGGVSPPPALPEWWADFLLCFHQPQTNTEIKQ